MLRLGPLFAGLLLAAPTALAQGNYQPYPVGERASGLGGAYTALADDEAGAFYNPAGPAFTSGNSLSVSTSLYGVVFGRNKDALGEGQDFTYSTLNLIPTTASSLYHFGEKGPQGGPGRWAFLFNVFSPATFELDSRSDLQGTTTLFQSFKEQTILVGPSLAHRYSDRLGLGVALYGSLHTFTQRLDLTNIAPSATASGNDFQQVTLSRDQTNFGAHLSAGARWLATDRISLGASLRSPTIHAYGKGQEFSRVAVARQGAASVANTATDAVRTERVLPLRLLTGVAYARPRSFALSADLAVYLPVAYQSVASEARPELNQVADYAAVVNGAVGAEFYPRDNLPVRFGLFTDLSPVPTPTLETGGSSEDQVQMVGATFSIGTVTEHTSSSFGLVGSYGRIKLLGIDLTRPQFRLFETSGSQWRLFFILSSSYSY